MKSQVKNLTLLGALLVNSSDRDGWPKAVRKVIKKAVKEMTSTLEAEQFKLYEKAGSLSIGHTPFIDDDE